MLRVSKRETRQKVIDFIAKRSFEAASDTHFSSCLRFKLILENHLGEIFNQLKRKGRQAERIMKEISR